ncbi:hypothetical protein COOONC_18842, partial [Cooperia oncophora]
LQNPDHDKRCDISYRVDARKIKEKLEFLERPLTDRNGSFGAQTFCRLAVMDGFIRDDVMFLKFEIEKVKAQQQVLRPASVQNSETASVLSEPPPKTPATISKVEIDMQPPKTGANEECLEGPILGRSSPALSTTGRYLERPPTISVSAKKPPATPSNPIIRPPSSLQPPIVAPVPVVVTQKDEIQESAVLQRPLSRQPNATLQQPLENQLQPMTPTAKH